MNESASAISGYAVSVETSQDYLYLPPEISVEGQDKAGFISNAFLTLVQIPAHANE